MASSEICSIPNCNKPRRVREWCNTHYMRWQRHGDPSYGGELRTPKGVVEAFYRDTVLRFAGDECLLWPFTKSRGYGQIGIDGTMKAVHRLVCIDVHGQPPSPSHQAAHNCGNKACCNPKHIRWATRRENEADKLTHGTRYRGSRHQQAKLTEADVRDIRASTGKLSNRLAGLKFGVNPGTISEIRSFKKWAWLT